MAINKFRPENRGLMLIEEPAQEFKLPQLKRENFEDALDEIELIGCPVSCSPFDLLKTKYRGSVFVKDLLKFHKKQVKILFPENMFPLKKG